MESKRFLWTITFFRIELKENDGTWYYYAFHFHSQSNRKCMSGKYKLAKYTHNNQNNFCDQNL